MQYCFVLLNRLYSIFGLYCVMV